MDVERARELLAAERRRLERALAQRSHQEDGEESDPFFNPANLAADLYQEELDEGLAEYFATAEIRDDEVSLGAVSPERMQPLKTSSLLPLKDFFAVESTSPYYNETSKASV